MIQHKHIKFLVFILIGKFSFCLAQTSMKQDKVPNIILIKTDDQRFNSLSMTGHPVTKTPNIDKLAKEGVFFANTFITSPICGPSRANIFTGQWERKNKIGFANYSKNVITEDVFDNSWLMCLKRKGYFTGYLGKHHTTIGPLKEHNKYMKESLDFCYMASGHLGFNLQKGKKHVAFSNLKNPTQIEGLFEATEAFINPTKENQYFFKNADVSVKHFLQERDASKPFCLSINFNLPHASSIGGMGDGKEDPEIYKTLYEDKKDQFPFPEGYPFAKSSLPDNVFRQDQLMQFYNVSNQNALRTKKMKMARAVTAIDIFIGNLEKELTNLGVADNTILVFMSDHGLLLGEHGLGGKTFLYEESVKIPFIIKSPFFTNKEKGKVINEMVVGQDIPATILDLCQAEIPNTYQGKSVVPLIKNDKNIAWRKEVFLENLFTFQNYPRMEAVRTDNYKYIRYFSKENDRGKYLPLAYVQGEKPIYEELFDLKKDPKEGVNLIKNEKYQKITNQLRVKCQELVKELSE